MTKVIADTRCEERDRIYDMWGHGTAAALLSDEVSIRGKSIQCKSPSLSKAAMRWRRVTGLPAKVLRWHVLMMRWDCGPAAGRDRSCCCTQGYAQSAGAPYIFVVCILSMVSAVDCAKVQDLDVSGCNIDSTGHAVMSREFKFHMGLLKGHFWRWELNTPCASSRLSCNVGALFHLVKLKRLSMIQMLVSTKRYIFPFFYFLEERFFLWHGYWKFVFEIHTPPGIIALLCMMLSRM